jgi:hypothetical protein
VGGTLAGDDVRPEEAPTGHTPESADFAAARVGGARRRPPIAAFGWVVVLVAVVALGLSGRDTGSAAGAGSARATPSRAATVRAVPRESARRTDPVIPPRFEPDMIAIESSQPGPIQLEATRQPSSVFVHGDVFAKRITWVFLALQSLDGRVGGWASVSVPGSASAPTRSGTPALRFDVELNVPTDLATGVLVVQANAYDASGALVGTTRVRLEPHM